MTQTQAKGVAVAGKGKAFFDRADQVASTGNWDFAIEMYLEGIQREPEELERGHKLLREVSLKRKAMGGKGPGMLEGMRHGASKDPIQNLRNAEFMLAKEPGSLMYMERVLTAAMKLELKDVTKWMADIMLDHPDLLAKKDRRILIVLTKAYEEFLKDNEFAVKACRMLAELCRGDEGVAAELKRLETNKVIGDGGYGDKSKDFTQGVKDIKKQQELGERDKIVKGKGFIEQQIDKARKDYEEAPGVSGKILGLVEALLRVEEDGYENEAIDVLTKAFNESKAYQYKLRAGDIRIRQMKRRYLELDKAGDKAAAQEHLQKQVLFELAEYTERAANYPTDMGIKFELGRRLLAMGKLDDAIAAFQQAQRDARRHVASMVHLGQAFTKKGWLREAGETYERTLAAEMTEERRKEILYHLGDVKEKMNLLDQACDYYSQLAQMDFNYKDVRDRLDRVRKQQQG